MGSGPVYVPRLGFGAVRRGHFSLRIKLTAYIVYMIAWCLVPAVLLTLGALPWLGRKGTMRAQGATAP